MRLLEEIKKPTLVVSLQANSPEIVYQDIDKAINHLIKYNLNEVDSVDKYFNQNGAIRVVRLQSLFQKKLSTHFGVIKTNINDIHTKQDLLKLKSKKMYYKFSKNRTKIIAEIHPQHRRKYG